MRNRPTVRRLGCLIEQFRPDLDATGCESLLDRKKASRCYTSPGAGAAILIAGGDC